MIGRRGAGAGSVIGRATVSGTIRREKITDALLLARALVSARAGLALMAEGSADQTAEISGELAPVASGSAETSGSAQAAASGGLRRVGSVQVIACATVGARFARMSLGRGDLYARAAVGRASAGSEMAGQAVVMAGATVAAGSGHEVSAAGDVSLGIATLALAGVALQASAVAAARAGMAADEAGTLKTSGGVLIARAVVLAIVAGQVPGLADVVARATVAATEASGAPWWGTTTVGGTQRPSGGVLTRGPFG